MILVVRGKKNGKFVSFSVNPTTSKIHVFSKNGELGFVDEWKYRLELSDLSLQDTWYNHHNKYGCHPHRFLIIAGKFFDSDIETEWDDQFNDLMEALMNPGVLNGPITLTELKKPS